ncbi:MAG: Calx-beta domain-containing protein [Bacteroidales bacterium]|nr:Calx-beta domain-containing protein [Bacteroidales bacterium]
MKILKYISAMSACVLLASSCSMNDPANFDDKDAFVSFNSKNFSIAEESDKVLEIPVLLTSLSGISSTVDFEITPVESAPAVEGKNFKILNSSNTLSFTKEAPTQFIRIESIDNDTFDGDVQFLITLKNSGVNIGEASTATVKVTDNEHPLMFILNTYHTSAASYFSNRGSFEWDIRIEKDATDNSKVWIANLEPYFATNGLVAPDYNYFYGFVSEDKTEIRIPVGQAIGYKDGDNDVVLAGFTGSDPDDSEELEIGGNIIISIHDDGNRLVIESAYGVASDGWWNLMFGNQTLTKK